jgi:glucosamine--fructose-6-phosphate aminotransferase (isomerizing)
VHGELAYILSTMVGHLFGYEAALAIDAQANPLREARTTLDAAAQAASSADELLLTLARVLAPQIGTFRQKLWAGLYDSALGPATTARLASVFSYVEGATPLDLYDREFGRPGTPANVVEDLTAALTLAIDDLTRPIDTIRHQAKTVTVGISRSDEELFTVPLVSSVLEAGGAREQLSYVNLRTLAALDAAVAEVTGYSRYRIERAGEKESIVVVDQGGSAAGLRSRTDVDPRLRGTKSVVASEREVLIARGRSDGRLVVFVPEVSAGITTGLLLLHVVLLDRLETRRMRRVLDGYRGRLRALASAVLESENSFEEERLAQIPVDALLTEPISILADVWSAGASLEHLRTGWDTAAGGPGVT